MKYPVTAKPRSVVLVVVALGVACLVSGELFARFYLGLGTPALSEPHPTIEYLFSPGQSVSRFRNRIHINEYGMRSDAVAVPKADTETRILVFGDSVINGGNTIDQSELATTIVANEQHGAGHDAYVGNVSAISWGPGNWLAYAREFGFIDADIVVLVLSGHDRHDNPTFAPLSPSTHPTKAPPSALLEALARYRAASVSSARVEGQVTYEDLAQEADADTRQGLEDLERFLSLAMASSQHVRVFYHPDRSEFDAGNVGEDFDVIRKTVESGGQTLVSLLPHYRILSGDSDALYADVIHPTGLGQRGIANAIIKSIATLE